MELYSKNDALAFSLLKKIVIKNLCFTQQKYMHQILNLSNDAYEEIFKEIDTAI